MLYTVDCCVALRRDGRWLLIVRGPNLAFAADLPVDAVPTIAAPDEVAAMTWWTLPELEAERTCPLWTLASVRRAAAALLTG